MAGRTHVRPASMQVRVMLLAGLALAPVAQAADATLARGKQLFTQRAAPPCAVCHALQDANSRGTVGPDLDELRPDAARVAQAVRQGLGNMPAFGASLAAEDIEALAQYVSRAAGR